MPGITFGGFGCTPVKASFVCRRTTSGSTNREVGVAGTGAPSPSDMPNPNLSVDFERSRTFSGVTGAGAAMENWEPYIVCGRGRLDGVETGDTEGDRRPSSLIVSEDAAAAASPERRAADLPTVSSLPPESLSDSSPSSLDKVDSGDVEKIAVLSSRDCWRRCGVMGRSRSESSIRSHFSRFMMGISSATVYRFLGVGLTLLPRTRGPLGGDRAGGLAADIGDSPRGTPDGETVVDAEPVPGRPEIDMCRLLVADVIDEGGELGGEKGPWPSIVLSGGVA